MTSYSDWLETVPPEISGDSLWRMDAYMIPQQRAAILREEEAAYQPHPIDLPETKLILERIPLPDQHPDV